MSQDPSQKFRPLDGVRVLDLTVTPPGGYCTVQLADMGAEVVRLEPPAQAGKPSLVANQVGLSRGKRSITLDPRSKRYNEVLRRLVATCDVLVENAKPGQMSSRGFGYPEVAKEFPALIWCSISGFGQDGPNAQYAGHDISYLGHAGYLGAVGTELPWHPGAMLSVPVGAMMAVTGILGAMVERAKTGKGCQIDVSLADASTWLLAGSASALKGDGTGGIAATPERRLYECADGRYVVVAAAEPRTWAALCEGLGMADIAGEGRPRGAAGEAAQARLAAAFATRPAREWVEKLAPLGAAVTIVNRGVDVVEDPHNMARGVFVSIDGETVPANPLRFHDAAGRESFTAAASPPKVGQDTEAVLGAAGFSADEIANLRAEGVI